MPLDEWPAKDREAWERAVAEGDLLHDAGGAAGWRTGTRDRVIQSYGRYLGHLDYCGILDRDAGPAERVTRERVVAYGEQLRQQCAPVTTHGYILNLERALAVMVPEMDRTWLRDLERRLRARARPSRDKRHRVVPVEELDQLAAHLMESALESPDPRDDHRAVRFRDGLMIAFLTALPLRLRSFTILVIGRHIIAEENGYRIVLAPEDTKNGRPYEAPIPARLAPYVRIYIEQMRPVLLGERASDRLWISINGTEMSESSIRIRLYNVTERELGRPIGPHLFRDCAMTSRAIDDPDNVLAMTPVLGHGSTRTSERHYNQAQAIDAARRYQGHILSKRQGIKRTRRRRKKGG